MWQFVRKVVDFFVAFFVDRDKITRELDWVNSTAPIAMWQHVRHRTSDRKFRLFTVAACRQLWPILTDERSRRAVDVAERYADGDVIVEELYESADEAGLAVHEVPFRKIQWTADRAAAAAAEWTFANDTDEAAFWVIYWTGTDELENNRFNLAELLREVVGNPFRSIAVQQEWLTPEVLQLANSIYVDRNFELLPLLRDELIKAGCNDEDIISHCSDAHPHCRGCWMIDLLLGKN